jgi:hypothetical protein
VKPTRPLDLMVVGLIGGVVVHLLIRAAYGSIPRLPLLAGVTLFVLAVAEVLLANGLRARIQRRPGTRPVQPLQAARAVALAKASALAGAIMAGAWLGVLGYVLPRQADVAAAAADTAASLVGLVCALALVGAALWLEWCCRTPDDGERDDDRDPTRRGEDGAG